MHHRLHYSRAGHPVSSRGACLCLAVFSLLACPLWSQYPGQITKKSKDAPDLRAVAVLEWTGEAGKPKACRMVPIAIFDGERLQDAALYLARPQPLALAGEVEYQLKEDGKTIGLFDIKNAGQEEGTWVGYGEWRSMPKPKPSAAAPPVVEDYDDDKPVLHRKKKSGGASNGSDSGGDAGSAPADPDRPKLHKKDDSGNNSGDSQPASDPGHPTLHKKTQDDTASDSQAGSAPVDPDRPTMKKADPKAKSKPPEDVGHVDSLPDVTDPDRPRLQRGKSSGNGLQVLPTLMGLPPDMQQAVAVSDAKDRPDHPWTYSWTSPEDEAKMKSALEDIARTELGLVPPPAPAPVARKRVTGAKIGAAKPAPPPEPAPLQDEQFRVFELAYGSGATMVLSANSGGPLMKEKFVTLIAQPDLYGNVLVVFKSVTDGAHLDETPRMRLVDAVDALADNRGELLFELRSDTARQFALYRVLRGTAEKLFVSNGGTFGTISRD